MNEPNPAIVPQAAVRRLPRWALLLLCAAYILPGFIARDPWKNADIAAYGVMLALHVQHTWALWLHPGMMGLPAQAAGLLPYWLGAWALDWAPVWIVPVFAVRLPFMALLAGTFFATWHAVRHLTGLRSAQPVAFAFGGEASPPDYARTLADAALLALVASLGLAQIAHETTPALAQLFFVSVIFYGAAALHSSRLRAGAALLAGCIGLALSGAPLSALACAVLLTALALWLAVKRPGARRAAANALLALIALALCLASLLSGLTPARWVLPHWPATWEAWSGIGNLVLWFAWPVWVFALWTLWRWRWQMARLFHHPHLYVPIVLLLVVCLAAPAPFLSDRTLLLALPALAALAAFALPTFRRSATSLIDSFTLLFFSAVALLIWIVWVSLQTGWPQRPAEVIARIAPQFHSTFQLVGLIAALIATFAWCALARWRTARHRPALWKSLVLPAAGATLCWLLLTTLWMPALNYARSYKPQFQAVRATIGDTSCVAVRGLSQAQLGAVLTYTQARPLPLEQAGACRWLITPLDAGPGRENAHWRFVTRVQRPAHKTEALEVYERRARP